MLIFDIEIIKPEYPHRASMLTRTRIVQHVTRDQYASIYRDKLAHYTPSAWKIIPKNQGQYPKQIVKYLTKMWQQIRQCLTHRPALVIISIENLIPIIFPRGYILF